MSNAAQVQFTPSVTASFPVTQLPTTITLPPVDGANTSVVLKNMGPNTMAIMAGSIRQDVFGAPGAIALAPGQLMLVQNLGLSGGTLATVSAMGNATLSFMRGSTADVFLFPAPAVAVF